MKEELSLRKFLYLIPIVISFIISGELVDAASVAVSPTRIEQSVRNGDLLAPITVTNTGEEPLFIHAYVGPGGHDVHGAPLFLGSRDIEKDREAGETGARNESSGHYESKSGIELLQDEFLLSPGDSAEILARVDVPDDMCGGIYPIIYLECSPRGTRKKAEVAATSRIAILTILTLPGRAYAKILAKELRITQLDSSDSVGIELIVENIGNTHSYALAFAEIIGPSGEVAGSLPLDPTLVLPGRSRALKGIWKPATLIPGEYLVKASIANQDQWNGPNSGTLGSSTLREQGLSCISRSFTIRKRLAMQPEGGGMALSSQR